MIQAETLELLEWSRLCQYLSTFAATKLGAIAARHLKIPATLDETQNLLAQTQEVYQLENRLTRGLSFDGISDIGASLERAGSKGILSGEELFAIATTLAGARTLRRVIDDHPDLPVLNELVEDLRTYPELEQEIHRCIDERGQVTDRATPKLSNIREQQRQLRDRVYNTLQNILQRKANAVQEQLITQREGRFVIPVKAPQKDAIPGIVHDTSMSGATLYVEPQATVNLNNQLRQLQRQEEAEAEAVRQALSEQVAAVKDDLERLMAIATTLDLATARARYSLWLEANPPRFVEWGEKQRDEGGGRGDEKKNSSLIPHSSSLSTEPIVLRRLRHPLLVWQHQHEQGKSVVPIDLVIQPHIRVVAITGPNTGGKTVTLKTLGLAILMAKVGLFIPAREPVELPWFDQVLADIGDEQSLQQSLSTFSGHIRRISRILTALEGGSQESGVRSQKVEGAGDRGDGGDGEGGEDAGTRRCGDTETMEREQRINSSPSSLPQDSPNPPPHPLHPTLNPNLKLKTQNSSPTPLSLVLLDEVGAGTDPSEGSALAIALLKYLAEHAGLTVATTHFGELKALKYEDERFENASVEFDDVSLSPTYRLLWGIPGRSNALAIAGRLGLSQEIVQQAQSYVGGASEDVNQVIAGLEAQRRRQETKSQEAAELLESAERLHRQVAQKAATLQERERSLQLAQEQAVQEAIAQAKREIAQVIRQLQQGPMTAQAAQQATDELNQISARQLPSRQQKPKPKPGFQPQVGDRIRIPRLGQTAEVLTAPNEDNELTVRFGLMKMTVALADIESLDGEKALSTQAGKGVRSQEETQNSKLKPQTAAPETPTPTPHPSYSHLAQYP
ncbi:endonuclease MutS2 [Kovacikia minuta CCNUW1]|uniref:endonuclease MutS2 n=1 Tax=Kovacikia minuta TaxID=2931930 RepID=UPI001CCF2E28|nr:endonuclease MutS2 [Kovacikia minuta]UBF27254.1 endonuclease MutS2 [Kovacikia minuta CCNUW1]